MEAYENVRNNDKIEVGYKMAQNRPYRLHRLQNMNVVHECVTVVTNVTSISDTYYIYMSHILRFVFFFVHDTSKRQYRLIYVLRAHVRIYSWYIGEISVTSVTRLQAAKTGCNFCYREDDGMSFRQWLRQQEKRDDPVGDLANDAKQDKRAVPRNTLPAWTRHLERANACGEAVQALRNAWDEYKCSY